MFSAVAKNRRKWRKSEREKIKCDKKKKRESRDYSIVTYGLFYSRSTETATGDEDDREFPFFTLICFYCS
jgi:hypothetical protein